MTTTGAIAAGHRLTAEAGAAVLRAGGNAVDAAIAAIAMACLCEPVLCSPGGGAFATVRSGGATTVIDAFVHTPRTNRGVVAGGVREVFADFGTARQGFRIGPATAATPGLFVGLRALADRHGSVALPDLVASAASAARAGIEVTPFQHHLATVVTPILTASAAARGLYAPDGRLLPTGSTFRNPELADALEVLAASGLAGSEVGAAVVGLQHDRGHLVAADLDEYQVIERDPLECRVGADRVLLNPPPGAGGLLVEHTLSALDSPHPRHMAEALAATDRARHDPSSEVAAGLADRPQQHRGTTHVSVVDSNGTACSVTASNGEGNGELVPGFGFMLNNMLGESDVNPEGDDWPTDVRLSSMMCPALIDHADGALTALGSGGSSRIRSALSQVIAVRCLDRRSLRDSVVAPRLHVERGHLDIEDQSDLDAVICDFDDHLVWPEPDLFFGGVHAVTHHADGSFDAVGDPRRSGAAVIVDGSRRTSP